MNNRLTRIDIENWMIDCWQLSGLELVVYALLYSELELTPRKICKLLNLDINTIMNCLNSLKEQGLISPNRSKREFLTEYNSTDEDRNITSVFLYSVDETSLL